jgi:pseudouridine synthase
MDVLGDFAAQHGVNRIFPIGRLDYHTTGLLLLTNDGNLAWTLTHPSNCVPRVYHAQIRGRITMSILHELVRGVKLDATWAKALDAYIIKHNHNSSLVEVSVVEGRTRLVRRMFAALGYLVMKLKRVAYGGIALGELRSGQIRKLSTKEIAVLKHWQTLTIQKSL